MNLWKQFKNDLSIQKKQGFFMLYTGLIFIYVFLGALIPETMKAYYFIMVFYSDPIFLGAFFIGSLIILEKQQGMFTYLNITPLSDFEYLLAKSLSLSLIALVVTLCILFLSGILLEIQVGYLILGVLLSSIFYINLGVIQSVKTQSINGYFIRMIPVMLILFIPLVLRLLMGSHWLFSIIPSVSGYEILLKAFYLSDQSILLQGVIMIFYNVATLLWALNSLMNNQLKGGVL